MLSLAFQPLLAADTIQTIIGIIVFILWIAGQLFGNRNEAKKPPKRQPRPNPQQQPGDLAKGAAAPQRQEDALRSEVEEFLRRVQGKPEQQQPARPQPERPQPAHQQMPRPDTIRPEQPPRRLSQEPQRGEQPTRRPQPQRQSRPTSRLRDEGKLREEGVAEHVARHISTQQIAEHTKSLGGKIASADERVESRLQEKFDHDLGKLQHKETADKSKADEPDLAAEIAAMLASPQGMRQVIVANEILRRPEW